MLNRDKSKQFRQSLICDKEHCNLSIELVCLYIEFTLHLILMNVVYSCLSTELIPYQA